MASRRPDQRRVQTSVTLPPQVFGALRDAAHLRGVSHSEVVLLALLEFLKAHHPALAEQAAEAVR